MAGSAGQKPACMLISDARAWPIGTPHPLGSARDGQQCNSYSPEPNQLARLLMVIIFGRRIDHLAACEPRRRRRRRRRGGRIKPARNVAMRGRFYLLPFICFGFGRLRWHRRRSALHSRRRSRTSSPRYRPSISPVGRRSAAQSSGGHLESSADLFGWPSSDEQAAK